MIKNSPVTALVFCALLLAPLGCNSSDPGGGDSSGGAGAGCANGAYDSGTCTRCVNGRAPSETYTGSCLSISEDTDGDGIPNSIDNCPSNANSRQYDYDDDGVGDACATTQHTKCVGTFTVAGGSATLDMSTCAFAETVSGIPPGSICAQVVQTNRVYWGGAGLPTTGTWTIKSGCTRLDDGVYVMIKNGCQAVGGTVKGICGDTACANKFSYDATCNQAACTATQAVSGVCD